MEIFWRVETLEREVVVNTLKGQRLVPIMSNPSLSRCRSRTLAQAWFKERLNDTVNTLEVIEFIIQPTNGNIIKSIKSSEQRVKGEGRIGVP